MTTTITTIIGVSNVSSSCEILIEPRRRVRPPAGGLSPPMGHGLNGPDLGRAPFWGLRPWILLLLLHISASPVQSGIRRSNLKLRSLYRKAYEVEPILKRKSLVVFERLYHEIVVQVWLLVQWIFSGQCCSHQKKGGMRLLCAFQSGGSPLTSYSDLYSVMTDFVHQGYFRFDNLRSRRATWETKSSYLQMLIPQLLRIWPPKKLCQKQASRIVLQEALRPLIWAHFDILTWDAFFSSKTV